MYMTKKAERCVLPIDHLIHSCMNKRADMEVALGLILQIYSICEHKLDNNNYQTILFWSNNLYFALC